MSAIARWCFRHRLVVIATWVVLLIGLSILAQAIKSDYNNSFSLPGTGSTTAQQLLAKASPGSLASRSRLSSRAARQAPAAVPWPSQV